MRYLWYQAARLVRNGIPRDEAIQSITLHPAKFLGLGDRMGALEPGMDANILLLSGDPLDAGTWVEQSIIEGRVVYEREKDYRLDELMTGREPSTEPEGQGGEQGGSGSRDEE
jgi:imidazolonepropionase-like amidohydrolase